MTPTSFTITPASASGLRITSAALPAGYEVEFRPLSSTAQVTGVPGPDYPNPEPAPGKPLLARLSPASGSNGSSVKSVHDLLVSVAEHGTTTSKTTFKVTITWESSVG